jgi:site-specific recombinase XerD
LKLERELKYRNYSPRTIYFYTNCLKYFLNYIKNDLTKINKEIIIDFIIHLQEKKKGWNRDIFDIKLTREPKKLPIALNRDEIKTIINNIKNEKNFKQRIYK